MTVREAVVFRCDTCAAEKALPPYPNLAPPGWYMRIDGHGVVRHYCSDACADKAVSA